MARLPRIVVPGLPHHITQRGNRRQKIFFGDADYALYRDLVAAAARRAGTEIWAYCLMPNHVHLIAVPSHPDGLRATFGEAHRRYTAAINARFRWTGHLFQGRFGAVAMDEAHLMEALRYVALNPVKAKLVRRARDWRWSSARAHLAGKDDALVTVRPVVERVGNMRLFLSAPGEPVLLADLLRGATVGRPLGEPSWIAGLEKQLGRRLAPGKRGPKPARPPAAAQRPKRLI